MHGDDVRELCLKRREREAVAVPAPGLAPGGAQGLAVVAQEVAVAIGEVTLR